MAPVQSWSQVLILEAFDFPVPLASFASASRSITYRCASVSRKYNCALQRHGFDQCSARTRIGLDQRFSGVIAPKATPTRSTANTRSKQGGLFLLSAKNDERFLPFAVEAQSAHLLT
jgi:hypothetical protein